MQIEAIYDQGKLEFISPVKLRSGRIRVKVEIPDEEVQTDPPSVAESFELPEDLKLQAKEMLDRFAEIRNAPLPPESELPELTSKQEDRMHAFAFREEIKGLR